jgi:hypothetical protein
MVEAAYATASSSTSFQPILMNALVVGTSKKSLLKLLRPGEAPFIFIDDGPLIDELVIPPQPGLRLRKKKR